MILIGIGSNLPSTAFGPPSANVEAALAALPAVGACVAARSSWYCSEPVPRSEQPWFINGVAALLTELEPTALLAQLLAVEDRFGRLRGEPNAARVLDLDLLDYNSLVLKTRALALPHPRLHRRRFVLLPLTELAPAWRHPLLHETAEQLLARLPAGESVYPLCG